MNNPLWIGIDQRADGTVEYMKPDIQKMHKVWDGLVIEKRSQTDLPAINFDEILSSVFSTGPFYYYVIDFFDMSLSHISSGFTPAHGLQPGEVATINDILALIHPDDMDFVAHAEKKAFAFIHQVLGIEKITQYKVSYNFRFRTAGGSYRMYNHQSLILTVDEKGNFVKSLNLHTDISHITNQNNFKYSLIGLGGEPSYLNMEVYETAPESASEHLFTKRELEIIKLISAGASTKKISEDLYISPETVKTHRRNIMAKAGCRNAAELIARSMSEGWI